MALTGIIVVVVVSDFVQELGLLPFINFSLFAADKLGMCSKWSALLAVACLRFSTCGSREDSMGAASIQVDWLQVHTTVVVLCQDGAACDQAMYRLARQHGGCGTQSDPS